jgi:hypothetical protein
MYTIKIKADIKKYLALKNAKKNNNLRLIFHKKKIGKIRGNN